MQRIRVILTTLLLVLAGCSPPDQAVHSSSTSSLVPEGQVPPNIIFIMADDLGYGDLGSYGQERIRTPHLDRMAQEGMRFTDFYAGSTVCAPSRSVLMTGQHTGHTRVRGNANRGVGVPLLPEDMTVAELLKEAGYSTGMFGKWGLGVEGTTGAPQEQGFDRFLGYLNQVNAHFYHTDHLWSVEDGILQKVEVDTADYSHDLIAEAALEFIETNREGPFFLYAPFTIPHAELAVPKGSLEQYTDAEGNSIFPETPYPGEHYGAQPMPHAAYAAMVSHFDRDVGRIIGKLEELGIDDNTVIFFTSDNGPHEAGGYDPSFLDGNGPLRGVKRDLYEGGIRVPMIARWPGHVPATSTSGHVGYSGDFFATAAELAGTDVPEEVDDDLDSISFLPVLLGREEAQEEHEYLYWEFYERGSAQAVRMGEWKAVQQPAFTGEIELYNLEQDLAETRDVSAQHPEVVDEIREIMEAAHTPDPRWTAR